MEPITGLASVAVTIALVNVAKLFGVEGKWSTLAAIVIGVAVSAVEFAFTNVITSAGMYGAVATGLLIGLTAAGVYDVSLNVGGKDAVTDYSGKHST